MPRVVPGGADRAPPRVSPGSPGASGAGEPRVAPRTDTPRVSPGARGGPAARLPGPDACGASDLQHLVGGPVPETFAVAGPIRVFATGDPVTMDYNPRRLNVEVSRRNRRQIVAISCG
ncbi:MAG: hypothetical protein H6899_00235 [Rhodobacter sp.]|nr:hypothetical protein [Paracoccaceae bacterium]MCC0078400.1 hypothetical protein [Rhodobacter sp.]